MYAFNCRIVLIFHKQVIAASCCRTFDFFDGFSLTKKYFFSRKFPSPSFLSEFLQVGSVFTGNNIKSLGKQEINSHAALVKATVSFLIQKVFTNLRMNSNQTTSLLQSSFIFRFNQTPRTSDTKITPDNNSCSRRSFPSL